jgi:hypothetical protein
MDKLSQIEIAIAEYHLAMETVEQASGPDAYKFKVSAMGAALKQIEGILDMPYEKK